MYDIYFKYKLKYPKEVVLIKSGTFYIAINEDAFILHKIFGYKLNEIKHGTKIGFPIASLEKVESCLYAHHIGYVVIDKENVERKKVRRNRYDSYCKDMEQFLRNQQRIVYIYDELMKYRDRNDLTQHLTKIEGIICKNDC